MRYLKPQLQMEIYQIASMDSVMQIKKVWSGFTGTEHLLLFECVVRRLFGLSMYSVFARCCKYS